jgi:hypothetical protein
VNDIPPVVDVDHVGAQVFDDMRTAETEWWADGKYRTDAYDKIMMDKERLAYIERVAKGQAGGEEAIQKIVEWLLRPWHTARNFPKRDYPKAAEALKRAQKHLNDIPEGLQLGQLSEVNLIPVRGGFEELDSAPHLGATGVSKTLSLLRPKVFVMWDGPIREAYGFEYAAGYYRFMRLMNQFAERLYGLWRTRRGRLEDSLKPRGREWTPPLAKLIDEWHWIRLTGRR